MSWRMNSKWGLVPEMRDILPGPGKEIVGAKDLVALVEQPVDEVRAEKTGAAGHQDPFARTINAAHSLIPLREFTGSPSGRQSRPAWKAVTLSEQPRDLGKRDFLPLARRPQRQSGTVRAASRA